MKFKFMAMKHDGILLKLPHLPKEVFDRKEGWRPMFRLRLTLYIRSGNLFVQDQSARGKPLGPFLHKSAR